MNKDKIHGFKGIFWAFLLSGLMACTSHRQPNILLFLVDDMGWQDTSVPFYQDTTTFNLRYRTPNMERLAAQGMKFTDAYANCVCSPTRVSLMSGMNAARHRVTNWTLKRNVPPDARDTVLLLPTWNMNGMQPTDSIENTVHVTPLAQLLKDHGYFTIHCGKAHFGAIGTPGANPLNLGFDINIAGHAAGGPGSYQGTKNFSAVWRGGSSNWDVPGLEKYYGQDINLTEALTREAIHALDSAREQHKPFFLYMAHYAVHAPIEADSSFIDHYAHSGLDPIEARYASMVESMDHSLGHLMDYIHQNNLDDNTIILFMSDNGGLSAVGRGGEPHTHNKPLASGKGSAYEGGIREPMMVYWPGITRAKSTTDSPVIIEDFYPTILDMAGIKEYQTVQHIDGKSFIPLLKGKTREQLETLYWHFPNRWGPTGPGIGASSTIRKGEWKLIYFHHDRHFELYNIKNDLGEHHNLADSEAEIKTALAKDLGAYLRSVNAQMPAYRATGKQVPWPDEAL